MPRAVTASPDRLLPEQPTSAAGQGKPQHRKSSGKSLGLASSHPSLSASPRPHATSSRASSPTRSSFISEAGLFERDVEFSAEHTFNAQEAQDVAIPPVLQEAATVLTSQAVPMEEIESLIRSASSTKLAGWQSPVSDSLCSPEGYHSPVPSRPVSIAPHSKRQTVSPARDGFFVQRATSPSYSSSPPGSSVLTPSTSPSPPPRDLTSSIPSQKSKPGSPPPPLAFVRSGSSSPRDLPQTSSARVSSFTLEPPAQPLSLPPSPQYETFGDEGLGRKTRRLSFLSYADLINAERSDAVSMEPLGSPTTRSPPTLASDGDAGESPTRGRAREP